MTSMNLPDGKWCDDTKTAQINPMAEVKHADSKNAAISIAIKIIQNFGCRQ